MIITLTEACDYLGIDSGVNDDKVQMLLDSIETSLLIATGVAWDSTNKLAKQVAYLKLWDLWFVDDDKAKKERLTEQITYYTKQLQVLALTEA